MRGRGETPTPGGVGKPPERRDQRVADSRVAPVGLPGWPARERRGFVPRGTDCDVDVVQESRELLGEITARRRRHEVSSQKGFGDADKVK